MFLYIYSYCNLLNLINIILNYSDISQNVQKWTRLNTPISKNESHHSVTIPVLPNVDYMMLGGFIPISYEKFSVWVVLLWMAVIGLTSYAKSK